MNKIKKFLKHLNQEQYEAATTLDGRILILAGAGTGKTATMVCRTANMLDEGIDGKNILLLTFTNKAAKEIKDRIISFIGPKASEVTACTFHSFCSMFLRRYANIIGMSNSFTIIDNPDAIDVISMIRADLINEKNKNKEYVNLKDFPKPVAIYQLHEIVINSCVSLDEVIKAYNLQAYEKEIVSILKSFMEYKKERNLLDYNDLLFFTERILETNEKIRSSYDEMYQYVSADEYQDTNVIQNKILNLLTKDYPNLAVVGDDNQSIYGWRGANIENILSFNAVYPDCKNIVLKQNYRSSQEILDLSNAVMHHAQEGIPKDLIGQFHGAKPTIVEVENDAKEKRFIVEKIKELHNSGIALKDMAVIMRSGMQSYSLEVDLTKEEIPFAKFGGIKFLEKNAVKDILAFLRVIVNIKDEIAWFRILQKYPGIGKAYAKKIAASITEYGISTFDVVYKKRSFAKYFSEIKTLYNKLRASDLQEQLKELIEYYYPSIMKRAIELSDASFSAKGDNFEKLKKDLEELKTLYILAQEYKSTRSFLTEASLDMIVDVKDDDVLNLTTIHSAKGLEYRVVFILDVINGITPKCDFFDPNFNEELRCFYVAITRAKEQLYLLYPNYHVLTHTAGTLSVFLNYNDVLNTLDYEKNIPKIHYDSLYDLY